MGRFSNRGYLCVQETVYFLNNIPKIIKGMDEMAKKFGKHQIFFDFFDFYNKSSAGRLPPPNLVNQKIVWAAMCDSIGLPNSLIPTF